MSATPEQRAAWEAMKGFAKREVGGKLQVGRYWIGTDSIDWFDYPLSRPPTIASTEPAGVVAVPVPMNRFVTVEEAVTDNVTAKVSKAAHDKPIKKRAKRKVKA